MKVQNLVGKFSIIGSNQNEDKNSYKGILSLELDNNNRIVAKWLINKSQQQFGIGFFKNNILVIIFEYQGVE